MKEKEKTSLVEKGEAPDTIDIIRTERNNLIKSLLSDESLQKYLLERHHLSNISKVRLEFIKRSLHTLLIAPVDLEHYGRLILEMRKNADVVPDSHKSLFNQDIEKAIKNFIY